MRVDDGEILRLRSCGLAWAFDGVRPIKAWLLKRAALQRFTLNGEGRKGTTHCCTVRVIRWYVTAHGRTKKQTVL